MTAYLVPAIRSVLLLDRASLALFFCASARIGLVLSGSFDTLIAIGSVLYLAVYLSGFVSLLILRRSEPDLPKP
jgi:amino acid transporter